MIVKSLPAAILLAVAAPAVAVPAYVVNEITVTDPDKFQAYAAASPATMVPFGGRYIVRGGNGLGWQGAPPANRIVIAEFPSRAAAEAWHDSPAYQKILPIREASSISRVYIVDGVAP